MHAGRDLMLTLDETTAEVARLLAAGGLLRTHADRRVSPVPDARTIRYYTTLGLLDRPMVEGRTALYGRRHVLQILAIKALQGVGMPLAEIQSRLYARSDAELEAIVEAAAADARAAPAEEPPPGPAPTRWRELSIAPGLRISAEEGWSLDADPAVLLERIRAALFALSSHAPSTSHPGAASPPADDGGRKP